MPNQLIPFEDAQHEILDALNVIADVELLSIEQSFNRVLAENIISPIDVPAYDNSAMDGFAFNQTQFDPEQFIKVSQRIKAGDVANELSQYNAARIFTGAMLPDNTLTVIPQELCEYEKDSGVVKVLKAISVDENIRRKGQDVAKGSHVFNKGRRLRAQDVGMLASLGLDVVRCYKKIRVAIVSTGNELLEPGEPLIAGKIFNSNRFMLAALVNNLDVELTTSKILADNPEHIKHALCELASSQDCIITTGGVSVGETDFVKQALEEIGQIRLWRLAIKPGKPFTFGRIAQTYFFGLPGNPVAAFVTYLNLVRPAIQKLQGQLYGQHQGQGEMYQPQSFQIKANFDYPGNKKRMEFLRVALHEEVERGHEEIGNGLASQYLSLYPNQSSGVLSSTCASDGFARIEIGQSVRKGDLLCYIPFTSYF